MPRAPRRVEMLDWATRGYSPAWYAAAQAYREDATKYCAEDGALFTVEFHEGNENAQMRCRFPVISGGPLPARARLWLTVSVKIPTVPSWSFGVGLTPLSAVTKRGIR